MSSPWGSSTENSAYQITHNPWDLDTIPGGSSGGSAAVVSADTAVCSLGSDTGGSIRQPAALCGVVGMKPTYGRVSRYGLVAFASSLDQIGPFTKDVTDCALLLNAICGSDTMDATSVDVPVPDFTQSLINDVEGLKIGVPKEYFTQALDTEIADSVHAAIAVLEGLGATVEQVSLPHTEYAIATYYIIAPAEASANLARYDGVRYGYRNENPENLISMYKKTRSEGFGEEVKRRIMLGTFALSAGYQDAYYKKAQKVRTLIKSDFDAAFEKVDVIATPTSPTPAFKIGERIADPLQMYLSDVMTTPASHAGLPGISVPCGLVKSGLPVGLQLLGAPFAEENVLRVAYTFEQNTNTTSKNRKSKRMEWVNDEHCNSTVWWLFWRSTRRCTLGKIYPMDRTHRRLRRYRYRRPDRRGDAPNKQPQPITRHKDNMAACRGRCRSFRNIRYLYREISRCPMERSGTNRRTAQQGKQHVLTTSDADRDNTL